MRTLLVDTGVLRAACSNIEGLFECRMKEVEGMRFGRSPKLQSLTRTDQTLTAARKNIAHLSLGHPKLIPQRSNNKRGHPFCLVILASFLCLTSILLPCRCHAES